MRSLLCALLVAATFTSVSVQARTLEATSNILIRALDRSLNFTSDTTTSVRDMKVVQAARDDAASFVASNQQIRGVQLEAALQHLRQHSDIARQASDLELAQVILAQ